MSNVPNSTQLILDAIEAAERSLSMAKKMLGAAADSGLGSGVTGIFDGEFMQTDTGKRYQVPPNYASKSMLVAGDTLKLIPGDTTLNEPNRFKQIEKVERIETPAVITKKDGKWAIVCEQGSFWVLPAAVKFFNGQLGQEVTILLPKNYKELKNNWATIKTLGPGEVANVSQKPVVNPVVPQNSSAKVQGQPQPSSGLKTEGSRISPITNPKVVPVDSGKINEVNTVSPSSLRSLPKSNNLTIDVETATKTRAVRKPEAVKEVAREVAREATPLPKMPPAKEATVVPSKIGLKGEIKISPSAKESKVEDDLIPPLPETVGTLEKDDQELM